MFGGGPVVGRAGKNEDEESGKDKVAKGANHRPRRLQPGGRRGSEGAEGAEEGKEGSTKDRGGEPEGSDEERSEEEAEEEERSKAQDKGVFDGILRNMRSGGREVNGVFVKEVAQSTAPEVMPLEARYKMEQDGWTRAVAVPDSGAQVSVAPVDLAPGYTIRSSEGSRRGQTFVSASNHEIANEGEQLLPTQSAEGVWTTQTWQLAEVSRPLLSIGEECDKGQYVMFGRSGGIIFNLETGEHRRFPRTKGGYEMEMWIPPPPAGFPRQGR